MVATRKALRVDSCTGAVQEECLLSGGLEGCYYAINGVVLPHWHDLMSVYRRIRPAIKLLNNLSKRLI
jgi:hypothetical protein